MSSVPQTCVETETSRSTAKDGSPAKWWIAVEGTSEGPHSTAYIAALLSQRRVGAETLVCEVGNSKWIAISSCQEIVSLVMEHYPDALRAAPPPLPFRLGRTFRQLTNPQLHWFANCICIYCIAVSPALFVVGVVFTFFGMNSVAGLRENSPLLAYAVGLDLIIFLADLATTTMLAFGGFMTLQLRQSGEKLIKAGLAFHLCWGVVFLLVWVVWEALLTLGNQYEPLDSSLGSAVASILFGVPLFLFCVACVVFEVVALVWLVTRDNLIPRGVGGDSGLHGLGPSSGDSSNLAAAVPAR